MRRIDLIRQMTDGELAEFLSKVDHEDKLRTCSGQPCSHPGLEDDVDDPCAVCMLHWLREAGPLMDEEGA